MAGMITMPKLGLTMTEGTVVKWLKSPGDRVHKGDPVAEISTDKITSEMEALEEGVLREILVGEGDTARVGTPLAVLVGAGESPSDGPSGTGGATTTVAPASPKTLPLSTMRQVIARRMKDSWTIAPHVTINMEVDMGGAQQLRERLNAGGRPDRRISVNDIVLRAAGMALREFPAVNAAMADSGIVVHEGIHIGMAVALEDGLLVPVIRDADTKSLRALSEEATTLARRAREHTITPDECAGGTFTVTNLGAFGVDHFTPIINQPESAILGVGVVKERPVVHDGQIVIRPVMVLSLSFDHRLIDGAVAARFLSRIRGLIEDPREAFTA